jgi:hypothetical protein
MRARRLTVLVGALVVVTALVAGAGSLKFTTTVPFRLGSAIELNATVGPVSVESVEFSQGSGGPFGRTLGGTLGRGDDVYSGITAAFECENPEPVEWEVTFELEFLDKNGELIDRAKKSKDLEGESKVVKVDHSTLRYVIPLIDRVEIKIQAEKD